jgi:hypothetical protein
MREILFRGNSTSFGWVFSDRIDGSNHLGFNGDIPLVTGIPVKPDALGQYTGLTDRNGVKIFEGDIVKLCRIRSHLVIWECAAFSVNNDFLGFWTSSDIEVIGNIHDNPELLGDKQ